MTIHGDLYYEGKEFETRLREKKPGDLSEELRTALGMPVGPGSHKVNTAFQTLVISLSQTFVFYILIFLSFYLTFINFGLLYFLLERQTCFFGSLSLLTSLHYAFFLM